LLLTGQNVAKNIKNIKEKITLAPTRFYS